MKPQTLTPAAVTEAQRILDRAARRILAANLATAKATPAKRRECRVEAGSRTS